jgi:hypothetical protein
MLPAASFDIQLLSFRRFHSFISSSSLLLLSAPGYVSVKSSGETCEGVIGEELLARLRCQATINGGRIINDRVIGVERYENVSPEEALQRASEKYHRDELSSSNSTSAAAKPAKAQNDGKQSEGQGKERRLFAVATQGERIFLGRTVLFASGIVDVVPPLKGARELIKSGAIKICAVCDAFELGEDEKVGLIAYGKGGLAEAQFLRTYNANLTYFTVATHSHTDKNDDGDGGRGEKQGTQPSQKGASSCLGHGSDDVEETFKVDRETSQKEGKEQQKDNAFGKKEEGKEGQDDEDRCFDLARHYGALFEGKHEIDDEAKEKLKELGVRLIESPVADVQVRKNEKADGDARNGSGGSGKACDVCEKDRRDADAMSVKITTIDGKSYEFSAVYSVMGTVSRAATFARNLGLPVGDDGRFTSQNAKREVTPEHKEGESGGSDIAFGAYAAGDCCDGLNQISVASGDAAVAATSINKLLSQEGRRILAGGSKGETITTGDKVEPVEKDDSVCTKKWER